MAAQAPKGFALHKKKHPSQDAYFQILLLISIFDNRNHILRPLLYLAPAKKPGKAFEKRLVMVVFLMNDEIYERVWMMINKG